MTQLSAERFQDAGRYTAYLRTTEGRLRTDLAWANLREFLPADTDGWRALDTGGGSGAIAIRLATLRFEVELVDSSEPMLAMARQAASDAALSGRIALRNSDVGRVTNVFEPSSFDVVVCHNHNLLEYVDNPTSLIGTLYPGPSTPFNVCSDRLTTELHDLIAFQVRVLEPRNTRNSRALYRNAATHSPSGNSCAFN